MKSVILLHNPGAGDEDHLRSDLIKAIEKEGYGCVYYSIKKDDNWRQQLDQADFAAIAGGDGTVRRVAKELLKRNMLAKKIPLAILPMGTANNLSMTLGVDSESSYKHHVRSWKKSKQRRFDVGVIKNSDTADFFLEGAGFGIFPNLIQTMDSMDTNHLENAKDELGLALEVLHKIVLSAKAERYWMKADGQIHEGHALLLEVMNIQSIGPNLVLAPEAATDDGRFNVVCVGEEQREDLARYIRKLMDGKEATFDWKTFTARELIIDCESKYMHVDDELVLPLCPLILGIREGLLEFMV